MTERCCGGAAFAVEDEEEDEEFSLLAEALLGRAEMVEEDAWGGRTAWTASPSMEEKNEGDEEEDGSDAAAALSAALLLLAFGLSVPVGQERESATTFAFPSR